jgi:hypothetical protein
VEGLSDLIVFRVGSYVLSGFARDLKSLSISRTGFRIGLSSRLFLAGAGSVQDSTAQK